MDNYFYIQYIFNRWKEVYAKKLFEECLTRGYEFNYDALALPSTIGWLCAKRVVKGDVTPILAPILVSTAIFLCLVPFLVTFALGFRLVLGITHFHQQFSMSQKNTVW